MYTYQGIKFLPKKIDISEPNLFESMYDTKTMDALLQPVNTPARLL